MVDHPGGLHDPWVGPTLAVAALLGPEQRRLLLGAADQQHPLGVPGRLEPGQVLVHDLVLALPLDEVDPRHALVDREAANRGTERLEILPNGAVEAIGSPSCRCT